MPARVVVLGEVLADLTIDSIPDATAGGPRRLTAHPGGSPANVAVGLARLGIPTSFAGRLSVVGMGPWLRDHLTSSGVDLSLAVDATENCSMALVGVTAQGTPSYTFYVEGTADWQWRSDELPDVGAVGATAVHTGSLAVALPPGRELLAAWLAALHLADQVLVSLDLNVRPTLIGDMTRYRQEMTTLIDHAHVVKASEEDLAALYPADDPLEVARHWAAGAPEMVVVTRGPGGATAVRSNGEVLHRSSPAVTVVDTVGAGDAFTAGFLAWLFDGGHLHPEGVTGLSDAEVVAALDQANRVASITCGRAGADPPRRSEL